MVTLFHSTALSLLKYFEQELCAVPETSDIFKFLADLPGRIQMGVEIRWEFVFL